MKVFGYVAQVLEQELAARMGIALASSPWASTSTWPEVVVVLEGRAGRVLLRPELAEQLEAAGDVEAADVARTCTTPGAGLVLVHFPGELGARAWTSLAPRLPETRQPACPRAAPRGPGYTQGAELLGLLVTDGESRKAIAIELGISAQYVGQLIAGKKRPSVDLIFEIEDQWPAIAPRSWSRRVPRAKPVVSPTASTALPSERRVDSSTPREERERE